MAPKELRLFTDFFEKIDLFKSEVPRLNLKGRTEIPSVCGGILSAVMLTITILYGGFKVQHLVNRANPTVSTWKEESVITSDDVLNFRDSNVRFAWAIEGVLDLKLKNDPRYVKTMFRLTGRKEGAAWERMIEAHEWHMCTE